VCGQTFPAGNSWGETMRMRPWPEGKPHRLAVYHHAVEARRRLKQRLVFHQHLFCERRHHCSCPPWRAWPGQKKKAVQKVQAPAQPFIAFDPACPTAGWRARLAEDQSARRARRVFSCLPHDLYDWDARQSIA